MFTVRGARSDDIPRLGAIETQAGAAFRAIGMDKVADDEPFTAEELRPYIDGHRAWVVVADGSPVAYLLVDELDGAAHIHQVSVDPTFAGQKLGLRLIEVAASWARGRRLTRMTLTTFAEVPWNAPYYQRHAFRVMPEPTWTPGLRAIRLHEAATGLDAWPRVCMERHLPPGEEGSGLHELH